MRGGGGGGGGGARAGGYPTKKTDVFTLPTSLSNLSIEEVGST